MTELLAYVQDNFDGWDTKDVSDLEETLMTMYDTDATTAAETAFTDFGVAWGLSPNSLFDIAEYSLAAAAQRDVWAQQQFDDNKVFRVEMAQQQFDAQLAANPYQHYLDIGAALNVNPSNAFDSSDYLQSLIDGMELVDENGDPMTVEALLELALSVDITPLGFYADYPEYQTDYPAVDVPADEQVDTTPEPAQSFNLSSAATVDEGGTLTVTVTATEAVDADTTFTYSVSGSGETKPEDFIATSGTVTILAGAKTGTFTIDVVENDDKEFAEDFTVTLKSGTTVVDTLDATINDTSANDNEAPTIAAQTFSYAENQVAGATLATVVATDDTAVTGFAIASGDTSGYFAIDATGKITLTAAGAAAGIAVNDFETTPNTFDLMVTASDAAGNTSTATKVTLNVTDKDDVAPVLDTATLSGSNVVLSYKEILDTASIPAPSDFKVFVGGTTQVAVNTVNVNGNAVTLGLATTPVGTVTVSYTPASSPVQDAAGNDAVALTSHTVTTDAAAPTITSSTPANGGTDVAVDANVVINFSEPVVIGTGNITITNTTDPTDTRSIVVTDATQVSLNGTQLTINPTAALKNGATYSVQIANTAFKDLSGNAYAGITNQTDLNFNVIANTGSSYTYTIASVTGSSDSFTGSAGDDFYNAGTNNSLETGDIANDPSTSDQDTMDASYNVTASTLYRPTITNVENINVRVVDASTAAAGNGVTATVDLSQTTGVKQLSLTGGTSGLDVTTAIDASFFGITSLATTLKMQNINQQGTAFDTDFSFLNTLLTGTSDAVTLGLSTVGQVQQGGAVDPNVRILSTGVGTGVETVNVSVSDGGRFDTFLVGDANATVTLTKLNVSGAGTSFRVDNVIDFNTSGTIDASGFSAGAIRVGVNANDSITVTGGGGNDRVDFNGGFDNTSDSMNGGGGTDTVVVDTILAAAPTRWTSVDVFEIDGDIDQDVDNVGNSITTFVVSTTTGAVDTPSLLDLPNAAIVTLGSTLDSGGVGVIGENVTLELKSDSLTDSLTVNIGNGAANVNIDDVNIDADTANSVNTLNIVSVGSTTAPILNQINSDGTLAAGGDLDINAVTINVLATSTGSLIFGDTDGDIAGDGTFNIGDEIEDSLNNNTTKFDASAATSATSVIAMGGTGQVALLGGAGGDILAGGVGANTDEVSGGGGADLLTGEGLTDDAAAVVQRDVLTGGDGNDTFLFIDPDDAAAAATFNTLSDRITDFVSGTDNITIGSGGLNFIGSSANTLDTDADGVLDAVNYVEFTLTNYTDAAVRTQATALGIADDTPYFAAVQVGTSTYVVFDNNISTDADGLAATQVLAELSGVSTSGIANTDFRIALINGGADAIVGTAGRDFIDGGAGADNITGALGADTMTGGTGVDTFVFVDGAGVTATASGVGGGVATVWEVAETLTFGNGLDTITDFTAGAGGDIISGVDAGAPTAALGVAAGATTGLAAGTTYYLSGNFAAATGIFTITANGAGADTLIIEGDGTAQTVNVDMILLVGVNSANLVAANCVA